jgi:hypothetical protein
MKPLSIRIMEMWRNVLYLDVLIIHRIYRENAFSKSGRTVAQEPESNVLGSVAQMVCRAGFPFPRTDLSHDFSDGDAERGEAVQDGDTDLELCNLTVEVPRHEALA